VLEEAAILGGDHRIDQMLRQQVDRHVRLGAAPLAQQRAIARQHFDARRGRAAQRHRVGNLRGEIYERDRERDSTGRSQIERRQGDEPHLERQAAQQRAWRHGADKARALFASVAHNPPGTHDAGRRQGG